jgi:hypothetical protein
LEVVNRFYITAPRERPDFRLVIAFLWHDGQNVNTDGNSHHPASRTWTELYIENREQPDQVVDVTPYQESPLILLIESAAALGCACGILHFHILRGPREC